MEQTSLKYLPDEHDVTDFRGPQQTLILTNQRLIFEGETRRLWVLPGGRALTAAMLGDVDVGFLGRQYLLPTWVGLLGILIALIGLLEARSVLAVLLGVVLTLAWYLLGGTGLEFHMGGHVCMTMNITGFGSEEEQLSGARTFVEHFFAAESDLARRP